jgi:hypothetical protein
MPMKVEKIMGTIQGVTAGPWVVQAKQKRPVRVVC